MEPAMTSPNGVEIKRLEGWMTFEEAGSALGISKQRVHKLVWDAAAFDTEDIRGVGARPLWLLRTSAVKAKAVARTAAGLQS